MENLVEIRNLSKTFKQDLLAKPFQALDNISFDVKRGKIIGFLGANGAGKSTTLKLMLGLSRVDEGKINFNKDIFLLGTKKFEKIGYLPERPYFYQHLTGRQFLDYMAKLNNMEKHIISERIDVLSERLKIKFALDRSIRGYSKGMLQRLGFVSAILHNPELVILDEPLSGLDPIGRKEFKDIILDLGEQGKTVFFSSHILNDVEEVCSEIVLLRNGRLVFAGTLSELLEKHDKQDYLIKIQGEIDDEIKSNIIFYKNSVIRTKEEDLNSVLSKLMKKNIKITSLAKESPRLEEIIFELRDE